MIKNKPKKCLMFSNQRFIILDRQSGEGKTFPEGSNGYKKAYKISKNNDVLCSTNALEQIKLYLSNEIDLAF